MNFSSGEKQETIRSLANNCGFEGDLTFVEGQELYLNADEDENGITNIKGSNESIK